MALVGSGPRSAEPVASTDPVSKPLVSIVIPAYNYGAYLAEAIESALAQTYSPVEVIVIDDGSKDDTVEVASRYADRIRLLTREQGPRCGAQPRA